MPRIPTPAELGWVQPTATRQIATVDASGLARGIEGFGNALTEVADREKQQQGVVQTSAANARLVTNLADIERKYKNDPNYQTFTTAAPKDADAAIKSASSAIADPKQRAVFEAHAGVTAARTSAGIADLAASKERTAALTVAEGSLKDLVKVYADPTVSQEKRDMAYKSIVDTIDMNEKSGLFAPEVAAKARAEYVQGAKLQAAKNYNTEAARTGAPGLQLGISPNAVSSIGRGGQPTPGGQMAAADVRNLFIEQAKRQGLVGFVPPDGAKYGIKTGSAEEWGNFFTGLSYHESGHNNQTVGDVGQFDGGSRGLLQLSYQDAPAYGMNNGKPFTKEQLADPSFNASVGVAIAKRLMTENGSIQRGMGKYWGPISKEGWTTGQGRDRGLPWQQWGAEVGSGPSIQGGGQQGGPAIDPHFADLSYEDRLAAQQVYDNAVKARVAEQKALETTVRTQTKDWYKLGIKTDDPSITSQSILRDGRLDNGDKAELLGEYEAREKHGGLARQMAAADADGSSIPLNRFDPDVRKGADKYADTLVKGGMSPIDAADRIQQRFGVVPSKTVSMLNGVRTGTDVNAAAQAGRIAYNMMMRNPNAFDGDDGGSALSKFAVAYAHNTQDLGYSPEKAAALAQAADDPNQRAKVKITDEEAKAFQKEITTASSITSLVGSKLDVSWWPGNPTIGQNDDVRKAMLSDFAQVALQNVRDGMTKDQAKAEAAVQLGRIWGVTKLQGTAMNGTVMKYPPEKRYPQAPDAKGDVGYGYILEQAADWVKQQAGHDVVPGSVGLVHVVDGRSGTLTTAAAWDANQPLPYTLTYQYKDKDGYTRTGVVDKPFVADPTRAMRAQVSKVDAANIEARGAVEARDAAFAAQDAVRTAPPKPVTAADIPGDNIPDEEKQIRADEMNRRNQADYDVAARMKADKGIDMSAAGLQSRQDRLKADAAEAAKAVAVVNEAGNEADATRMNEAVKASRGGVSMSQAELEKRKARLTEQEKAARRAVLKGGDK